MTKHGEAVDMTPRNQVDDGGLYVDEKYILFWCENEKKKKYIETY